MLNRLPGSARRGLQEADLPRAQFLASPRTIGRYAGAAARSDSIPVFATVTAATGAPIRASASAIWTLGYTTLGRGATRYVVAASEPAHDMKFQSADLRWWEPDEIAPYIEQGGGATGGADNTPALNRLMTYCEAKGVPFIHFRSGAYNFNSKPNSIDFDIGFRGKLGDGGATGASLHRNYDEGTDTNGLFHITAGRVHLDGLYILAATDSDGGCGISIVASGTEGQPGIVTLNNIRVTAGGAGVSTWKYSLYADGTANDGLPLGLRSLEMTNCNFFGADISAVYLSGIVHGSWRGGGAFPAGGLSGNITITGTAAVPTQNFNISIDEAGEDVILDRVDALIIDAADIEGDVTATANTTGVIGRGTIHGALSVSWANSQWQSGATLFMSPGGAVSVGGGDATLTQTTGLWTSNVPIALPGDPASALHAAPKQYVDDQRGWVLLNTLTASASSELIDITSLTSTYDAYKIAFENILPASDATFEMEVSTDGGSTWKTTGYISTASQAGLTKDTLTTAILLSGSTNLASVEATAGFGLTGEVTLNSPPSSTAVRKIFFGEMAYLKSTGTFDPILLAGYYNANAAINGVRFFYPSVNITSGKIRIYGVRKT